MAEILLPEQREPNDEPANSNSDTVIADTVEKMTIMQREESKLMSKFPKQAAGGQSKFLQSRLQHRKFFDSGDYNIAKAKDKKPKGQNPIAGQETPSISDQTENPDGPISAETGLLIPTPETIPHRNLLSVKEPQRRMSLIQPQTGVSMIKSQRRMSLLAQPAYFSPPLDHKLQPPSPLSKTDD